MIIYLSGNFPQLAVPRKERAFKERLHKNGHPYHRLMTFFYPERCQTMFDILEPEKFEHKTLLRRKKTDNETLKFDAESDLNSQSIVTQASDSEIEIPEILTSPRNAKTTNLFEETEDEA